MSGQSIHWATACALLLLLSIMTECTPQGCSAADRLPHAKDGPGADGEAPKYAPNRLADETSPYLLMHAHNPVAWYPWGEVALTKARDEGKMIFLSIGYSSCYWCHVMERESFLDEEIAAVLNEHFISIKVDREERPDIDAIYMTALQVYNQAIGSPSGGGWPMSMFLSPEADPVMGGTYYPPRDRAGMPGFLTVVRRVHAAWTAEPDRLSESARQLADVVRLQLRGRHDGAWQPTAQPLGEVLEGLSSRFDPEYGGFGYSPANPRMPKFPEPSNLLFLLDCMRRDSGQSGAARDMLTTTLEQLARGGIRDHAGGGFHRYSTDRYWAIPHFEKMLYDNGQLATVFAEAYELTGNEEYRHVVEEMVEFLLREMKAPEGGFYAALDAETEAEEGRFYVWEYEELEQRVDGDVFPLFAETYGVTPEGNFEGRTTLLLPRPLEEVAAAHSLDVKALRAQLRPVLDQLLTAREERQRPLTDTKILTAWNGLMIRGLADAGRIFQKDAYVEEAAAAADFVLGHLQTDEGRLMRTYTAGEAKLNAYLDDYAFLVDGLLALHRATGDARWLEEAERLTRLQLDLFWDEEQGGFFFTSSDHETLIARSKDPADSALPSGNAVSAGNLLALADALDTPEYRARAERTIACAGPIFEQIPVAVPRMGIALAAWLDGE